MSSIDEFVHSSAWLIKVSGAQRGRERHAALAADTHGGRLAARAQPPRPLPPPRPADNMELADVPRHRPLAFDKMESLIKEMQDPETGVPVRSQKLFLSVIPSAFMGYDLVEWLMERFNLDETSNGECFISGVGAWIFSRRRNPVESSHSEFPQALIFEAINLANQLCQYGYFFPVNDLKNLVLKDDSSLYRFQSPYYWPWQAPRVAGSGSSAPTLGPDNVEYAIYLVKRTLRNKQRHGLEEYEQETLANLKKNLAAKWDFITMQAEEQVRLAKERKKGDKIVSDSQERAYWRVARPPPGVASALEPCPVPVRVRHPRPKRRTIHHLTREIEHLKVSLDRTRVKTSIALEALVAYSETFAPYDPWLTPPQPSNPWVSDDTLFWQINSPLVEVPSEKRVQRWALSIEELVSDPTGLQEFTSFLRKEYSHENIRFWLAVMDLRRSSTKQIPKKLEEIYEEFLKPGAPCEINIDGATAERVNEGLRSGSRYALDHAADHVYGLLLKKDCYPRFVRSDHFQRLLTEGRNVHQKKAKFFNFGGQVKKKPGSTSGSGSGSALTRRRGSDRSLSGSAHELAVCAAQPPRAPEPPPHSHSQSNLADIPFRDPLDDDTADVLPWESSSREGMCSVAGRRRQDSTADSGSSSSDVSAAVAVAERTRRLPQQSTLDGGLRGAPPPLRRLSAVEPRHLAPLGSPPHEPKPIERPRPAPPPACAAVAVAHPTPTISVSSAPDDESAGSGAASPDEPRSQPASDDPPSVFASADATPTDPSRSLHDRTEPRVEVTVDSASELLIGTTSPASSKDSQIADLPCPAAESSEASEPPEPPPAAAPPVAGPPAAAPVAPLAVCEDIGVDDDNVDKVPSAPMQRVSAPEAASESDARNIAHKDELSSVSESNIVKRDNKSVIGERKRNDICPWEDENSCESDAPFVKTYATLGYL
ncbi:regulator of G-protein signaling 9 isoform X2 [Ostrinia furnacalis]|uniref:regulator of G-protein signaling 9 isoform X2 n=1 Tax=Ostrinia furnacalis TaxID=93504 RepID=UPI00103C0A60|nr:regulator of G-protein signaling 9 isoform X2 [Ostrinia furnacalis]